MKTLALAIVIPLQFAFGSFCAGGGGPGADEHTLTMPDGTERTYHLQHPDSDEAVPLVVDMHGLGSTAVGGRFGQREKSGWSEKAEEEGFAVAWPQGIRNRWDRSDVAFIEAVVADVADRIAIDRSRVYATGHSNGGILAHWAGCDAADTFAAIVPVAGSLHGSCNPSRPVAVLQLSAEGDRLDPGQGQSFAAWLNANGCQGPGEVSGSCRVHGCNGTPVRVCLIPGATHRVYSSVDVAGLGWEFVQ